jgi:hypothetical protein
MNTQWIKTSDRAPTEADLPVWAYYKGSSSPLSMIDGFAPTGCTHWRPAKDDIPEPPQEETQAEKDNTAFSNWCMTDAPCGWGTQEVWHAALAYEREQVAKMLPMYQAPCSIAWLERAIESIRARCEGGRK